MFLASTSIHTRTPKYTTSTVLVIEYLHVGFLVYENGLIMHCVSEACFTYDMRHFDVQYSMEANLSLAMLYLGADAVSQAFWTIHSIVFQLFLLTPNDAIAETTCSFQCYIAFLLHLVYMQRPRGLAS